MKVNCKFCSVGLNPGVGDDADEKAIESNITYVDFNTGHLPGETYLDILEPYIRRTKRETGLLLGVQTPPHHDLRRYDGLREMGVNRVSFGFEIFDPEIFRETCPGKHVARSAMRVAGVISIPYLHAQNRHPTNVRRCASARSDAVRPSTAARYRGRGSRRRGRPPP